MLNPCVDPFAAAGFLSVCVSLALVCSISLSLSLSRVSLARERASSTAHRRREQAAKRGGVGMLRGLGPRRIGRLLG